MNDATRHPADIIHLAARLRALLGLGTSELAQVLGVEPRTMSRMETWSGSLLTAVRSLAEVSVKRVPALLIELATLHSQRASDPADPASLAALGAKASAALEETSASAEQDAPILLDLLARPLPWIYWATSARAGDTKTRELADRDGLIVRPLLQRGTASKTELHPYLLALRPGDEVLLCHDANPVAWYVLERCDDGALADLARQQLHRFRPSSSHRSIDLVDALPSVFRRIDLGSPLGRQLASLGYMLFDGSKPPKGAAAGWFSALGVSPLTERSIPSPPEFSRRPAGERARMTRFRRPPAP